MQIILIIAMLAVVGYLLLTFAICAAWFAFVEGKLDA
jgi:hypothetical protein